jgi:hypothetical protein
MPVRAHSSKGLAAAGQRDPELACKRTIAGAMTLTMPHRESEVTLTGGCLCGAVRWESQEPPITTRVCWCRDCQYLAAGSGAVGACFRTAAFQAVGNTTDFASTADSGNRMHRRFCSKCGTPLFSEAEARPHLIFVRVGSFDDPNRASPAMTIWTASAPSWACIHADLPRVAQQPPPAA